MQINIWAVAKLAHSPEKILIDNYLQRCPVLGKQMGWKGFAVREFSDIHTMHAAVPDNAYIVACDERGEAIDSSQFATMLHDVTAPQCLLLIGGADGLGDTLRQRAQRLICFGRMTMPHMLLRVVLSEQIYRACTLLTHHPYHRG